MNIFPYINVFIMPILIITFRALIRDKSEILSSLNILHESVMHLKTKAGQAQDRTNIATDTKSAQSVVDFVLKHMFEMNDKLYVLYVFCLFL